MLSRFALEPGNFPADKDLQAAQAYSVQIAAGMSGQESACCVIKAAKK